MVCRLRSADLMRSPRMIPWYKPSIDGCSFRTVCTEGHLAIVTPATDVLRKGLLLHSINPTRHAAVYQSGDDQPVSAAVYTLVKVPVED